MKKKRILVITISILIVVISTLNNTFLGATAKQVEESQDILYQDVIITALSSTINTAVNDYYKNILSETPFYIIE